MFDRSRSREWAHGLTALILGAVLLGAGVDLGISKSIVDLLGGMLSIPERPAILLREACQRWWGWARDRDALQEELAYLRDENAKLRILSATAESERLRTELDARMSEARVTLRAPMSWWNEIRIDWGERDGATVGAPIFHQGFLIGRITSVSLLSSWVELLTSPSMMIPVVVEETRELGVVVGDGEGNVLLSYIPAGRGLTVGMKISTALISEQLPPGLPIGKIAEELKTASDGHASYRLELGADLGRAYAVSLMGPVDTGGR